jgi:hypothetical protein
MTQDRSRQRLAGREHDVLAAGLEGKVGANVDLAPMSPFHKRCTWKVATSTI